MLKNKVRKVMSVALAVAMIVPTTSIFASQTDKGVVLETYKNYPKATGYPIDKNPKFTYWMELPSNNSSIVQNFGQTEFAKAFQKQTGASITYIHPASGQGAQTIGLLVASQDLPDIIEWGWAATYPGGAYAAMGNGAIVKLNDLMAKNAPGLTDYYKRNPEIDKQVKTDDGTYFCVPFIRSSMYLQTTSGPMLRKDWLDDLGLRVPVTLKDWESVLTAFKDKKGATAPFSAQSSATGPLDGLNNMFLSAFKLRNNIHVDGQTVKFAAVEPEYKDYLTQMNAWYKAGLIDKNFMNVPRATLDAQMTTGVSGATYQAGGGAMGAWIPTAQSKDPNYDLVAATPAIAKAGDKIEHFGGSWEFTQASNAMAGISPKCKNQAAAMKLLDYAYTQEGYILHNFGTQGVSYTMVNGVPTYTTTVSKNTGSPKMTFAQALSHYARANNNGAFVQDQEYILQYYELPQQKNALKVWSAGGLACKYTIMPPVSLTSAESSEYSKIFTDINTYVNENAAKFITGQKPLAELDDFQAQIKKMNVDKMIALQQAALDRYYKRK